EGREAVAELVEREAGAGGDLGGALERVGVAGEAAHELLDGAEVALAVHLQAAARVGELDLEAHAGLDVVDAAEVGMGVAGVLSRDGGGAGLAGEAAERGQPVVVAGAEVVRELDGDAVAEGLDETVEPGSCFVGAREGAVDRSAGAAGQGVE